VSQPLAETAIEVTADTGPADEDLDNFGKRTRRRKVTVGTEADTRTMLRQIERALDSFRGAEIEVDAGTAGLIRELDAALDGFTGDVNLDPDIARLVAEVDSALAGMSWVVPVEPKVDIKPLRNAKGQFVSAGGGLGGAAADGFDRAFGPKILNVVKKVGDGIGKIAAPIGLPFIKAAAGALAFAGALSQISGLVAALAPVIGLALGALPGFLLARAAALGVFKLAVIGVGDALQAAAEGDAAAFEEALKKLAPEAREFATAARDMIDSLRPIQQAIQNVAFGGLAEQVTAVGQAMQGTRDDAVSVALGFNRIASEALGFAGSDQAVGAVNSALALVRDILFQIEPAVRPLLDAFAGLATQAGQFGTSIGTSVAAGLTSLAGFISQIDLKAVFEAALPSLQALGAILSNVGAIATSVFQASGASGAGLLGVIADLTGVVSTFLQSAGGFEALSAIMGAAAQVGQALGGALGTLLPPLGQAIGAIAVALGPLAGVLGQVLGALAPLLPPLGQLIGVLGTALVQAIVPLVPVISQLATLFGTVLGAAAPILAQLGNTIASILAPAGAVLADLFRQLGPVIGELVGALGGLLAPLLSAIGPLFTQLLGALLPLLPSLVALIPPLVQIVVALTPLITLCAQLLGVVVAIISPILQMAAAFTNLLVIEVIAPILTFIANAFTSLIAPLTGVAAKLGEFSAWLNSIDWSAVGAAISGAFTAAWNAVVAAVNAIVTFVTSLPGRILSALAAIPGLVLGLFQRMGQLALQAIGVAIGLVLYNFLVLPGKIGSAIASIPGILRSLFVRAASAARSAAVSGFNSVVSFISSVPGRIGSALGRLGGIISGAWNRALTAGRAAAVRGFNSIVSYVQSIPGRIAGLAGRFVAAGGRIVRGLVDGLKRVPSLGSIGSAIAGVIRRQANAIINAINSGISKVDSLLPGSLPRIPNFARGGVVDQATLGVFGEAGREVIIPLEKPARARELAEQSGLDKILATNPDGSPVYVSMRAYIGSTEITRMITFEVDRVLDDTAAQVDAGVRAF
jgi:hypothetical protein